MASWRRLRENAVTAGGLLLGVLGVIILGSIGGVVVAGVFVGFTYLAEPVIFVVHLLKNEPYEVGGLDIRCIFSGVMLGLGVGVSAMIGCGDYFGFDTNTGSGSDSLGGGLLFIFGIAGAVGGGAMVTYIGWLYASMILGVLVAVLLLVTSALKR